MSGLWWLGATGSPSPTPIDPSSALGSPGFLGFVVSAALAVAVIVLVRSMVTHLRRVQRAPEPDAGDDPGGAARADGSDGPARSDGPGR